MSEYQYYEFQTIDKNLTPKQYKFISEISSRGHVTYTSATFVYNYSDLPVCPDKLLEKYFDAMCYIANWGTIQLMFKFPYKFVTEEIEYYLIDDSITLRKKGANAILSITFCEQEFDWIEGEGCLSPLLHLREELLNQDYRFLYIAWLKAAKELYWDEEIIEPPIPEGLKSLSETQKSFIEIFFVDPHLVSAGAQGSDNKKEKKQDYKSIIESLSLTECQKLLFALVDEKINLKAELKQKINSSKPLFYPGIRNIVQLSELSEDIRIDEDIKKERLAKAKRKKYLQKLSTKEDQTWKEVNKLLTRKAASAYDKATSLLKDLKDMYKLEKRHDEFKVKVDEIKKIYYDRPAFLRRLKENYIL